MMIDDRKHKVEQDILTGNLKGWWSMVPSREPMKVTEGELKDHYWPPLCWCSPTMHFVLNEYGDEETIWIHHDEVRN